MQNRQSEAREARKFNVMKEENIEAVEKFLNALRTRDLSLAPLADEMKFEDSVAGKGNGAENFRAFLSGFLPAVNGVKVIQHICEEDYVVTHWEVDTVFGIIPILEKFRVRNGQIVEAVGYFDPRPVLGN
ncbi:MAG: nuclear transport factor 2 family protein [Acidobacteriota bacterium]|nr:nuclear transport factor 2 family protein [Acidobacteriota bacterium]